MSNKNYVKFPCPICGEIPDPIFSMKDKFDILIYLSVCPDDNLIFLNPRWTDEQYIKYYSDEYDHVKRKQIFKKIEPNRKMYKHGRSIYKRVKQFCRHPKSILDIGAGDGRTLDFLKSTYGVDTYFIEPSIECQKQMKERGHIFVDFGTDIKFDLLTSRHVLEHISDPIQHLKNIRSLMHDDSFFHIAFPNGENTPKKQLQNPHIYYFNKEIFYLMAKIVGLEIIKCHVDKNEAWFILKKYDPLCGKIEDEPKIKKYNMPIRGDQMQKTILVSFPKTGRTWLELLIGKYYAEYFNIQEKNDLSTIIYNKKLRKINSNIPHCHRDHIGKPYSRNPKEMKKSIKWDQYKNTKIIFLVRDPRDTVVSFYQYIVKGKSNQTYKGNIHKFIRDKRSRLDTLVVYYNTWLKNRSKFKDFLLVKYEDLKKDTFNELKKIIKFLDTDIKKECLEKSVSFCEFNNMKKMEKQNPVDNELAPGDKNDPESYKARRGVVGGYVDYLSKEDVEYIDKVTKELDDFYSCYKN